jgi:hypothetical protein
VRTKIGTEGGEINRQGGTDREFAIIPNEVKCRSAM